mgnify:CR=1 FL=1
MFPWQNKGRSLQQETSAAEEEPKEPGDSANLQMKQLRGHIREEWENIADGKRRMQQYHLTAKGWVNFRCKPVFLNFISPSCCHFSSYVLAVHLFLSWELIVSSMGDCWHEENTVIKVRTEDVGLASPFQSNWELLQQQLCYKSNVNLLDAAFRLAQVNMTYIAHRRTTMVLHGGDHFSGNSLNRLPTKCKVK